MGKVFRLCSEIQLGKTGYVCVPLVGWGKLAVCVPVVLSNRQRVILLFSLPLICRFCRGISNKQQQQREQEQQEDNKRETLVPCVIVLCCYILTSPPRPQKSVSSFGTTEKKKKEGVCILDVWGWCAKEFSKTKQEGSTHPNTTTQNTHKSS